MFVILFVTSLEISMIIKWSKKLGAGVLFMMFYIVISNFVTIG